MYQSTKGKRCGMEDVERVTTAWLNVEIKLMFNSFGVAGGGV